MIASIPVAVLFAFFGREWMQYRREAAQVVQLEATLEPFRATWSESRLFGLLPPTVKEISISGKIPRSTMEELGVLSQLEVLSISRSDISSGHTARMRHMPSVRKLSAVLGRNIDDRAVEDLCENMPYLEALNLRYTAISDESINHIARLRELQALDVSDTQVTGRHFEVLVETCGNLRRLDVSSTRVGDAAVECMTRARSLEVLKLEDTRITEAGVAALARMTWLRDLSVWGVKVSEETKILLYSELKDAMVTIGPD